MQPLKSRIEAVLFSTGRALSLDEICVFVDREPDEVEDALLELIMDYSSRDGALEIDDEDGYILQVKEEYGDIVERICPIDLSAAVLRTLSIIALKKSIRQSELVKLRSNAYEHIAELVEKGLVTKQKDKNGRSINLKTTSKFKEYFKITGDIDQLAAQMEREINDKKDN
ncbi:SMC-Scp complex subunit ScpB [bacterium]|nr:SMC-Scp complex subunit ScpB [bacterium]